MIFYTVSAQDTTTQWIAQHEAQNYHIDSKLHLHSKDGKLDGKFYRIHIYINPDTLYISGRCMIQFQSLENTSLPEFDLSKDLKIDSVLYKGQRINVSRTAPDKIGCYLPQTLAAYTIDSIEVFYQGSPSFSGMGSFMKGKQGGYPVIWTLSQPYGAKDWWPCRNSLGDKADSIELYITSPQTYSVAANGLLVDTLRTDTHLTWHYKHRYPIAPYLVAVAVTKYIYYQDTITLPSGRQLNQDNLVYPEDELLARKATAGLLPMIVKLGEKFGEYPFAAEKHGHAQFGRGGGMEHQTMSFVGTFGSRDLLVHELAHQWFGDMVTCLGWPHLWLNEGFATYLTGLSYEWLNGPVEFRNWRMGAIGQIVSQPDGSVYTEDTLDIFRLFSGRLTYTKGALVLHMLRNKLGDSLFYDGVNQYLHTPGIRFGFATTQDFMNVMEKSTGQKLDTFFSEWVYGEGFPYYEVDWKRKGGLGVELRLRQTPSHSSVSLFHQPVNLRLCGQGQCKELTIYPKSLTQQFDIETAFRVDTVMIDPEFQVICKREVNDLNDSLQMPNLLIYPNPGNGNFAIQSMLGKEIRTVEIYSLDGKQCVKLKVPAGQGARFSGNIPYPFMSNEMAIIRVEMDNGEWHTLEYVQLIMPE